jgi:hypothetical protein
MIHRPFVSLTRGAKFAESRYAGFICREMPANENDSTAFGGKSTFQAREGQILLA